MTLLSAPNGFAEIDIFVFGQAACCCTDCTAYQSAIHYVASDKSAADSADTGTDASAAQRTVTRAVAARGQ